MAAKVGGIYVSLALNTAEFSAGTEKSVAEMRKFDKAQAATESAIARVNTKWNQQATIVAQLALQHARLGPLVSAVGMSAMQYYSAMQRAAEASGAFNKSGAALSATLLSIKANAAGLITQISYWAINSASSAFKELTAKVKALNDAMAEFARGDIAKQQKANIDALADAYDAATGKTHERTMANIASEMDAARKAATENRDLAEKTAQTKLSLTARLWMDLPQQRRYYERQQTIVDEYTARYNDSMRKIYRLRQEAADKLKEAAVDNELSDFFSEIDRASTKARDGWDDLMDEVDDYNNRVRNTARQIREWQEEANKRQQKELAIAKERLSILQQQQDAARRYAGLVVGVGTGAYSGMLASREAAGVVFGLAGDAQSRAMLGRIGQGEVSTREMERLLSVIANAVDEPVIL